MGKFDALFQTQRGPLAPAGAEDPVETAMRDLARTPVREDEDRMDQGQARRPVRRRPRPTMVGNR